MALDGCMRLLLVVECAKRATSSAGAMGGVEEEKAKAEKEQEKKMAGSVSVGSGSRTRRRCTCR